MVTVPPDAEELGGERLAVFEEIDVLDEREAGVAVDPACQQRRDGEEELVDQALGEQRAPGGRAALGEDQGMPAGADGGEDCASVKRVAGRDDLLRQGGRAARRRLVVVRTIAPAANAGWAASTRPLRVSTTTSGSPERPMRARSSAKASAASGNACLGVQAPRGEASSVPEPTTTASAQARRSPITNRSAALAAAISLFDPGTDGIAVTPSMRLDEVRKHLRLLEPEGPAVEPRELVRQWKRRQPDRLPVDLERIHQAPEGHGAPSHVRYQVTLRPCNERASGFGPRDMSRGESACISSGVAWDMAHGTSRTRHR